MRAIAYVINEPCIGVKDNSCVEVCPVDCIHPTPDEPDNDQHDQLYIDPEECTALIATARHAAHGFGQMLAVTPANADRAAGCALAHVTPAAAERRVQ
jgi:NAD-dependent dihydropyrimidine dehydrogenase PreA subunit